MELLEQRLKGAAEDGETFVTIWLRPSEPSVDRVATFAMTMHWHVQAVWQRSEVDTCILLNHRPA